MLTGLIAALLPVPDWSTSLATMIGIGVGIDYALLMVTRFREWRAAGLDPENATVATLDTAGRSVLLAGGTVVISMLGLFGMGLSFMRGAALVTIAAIAIVLLSAITLFPALLGYSGAHLDRLRLPSPAATPASTRRRPARAPGGCGGAVLSSGTGSPPPPPGWGSCSPWPPPSSGCTSGSPIPATAPRAARPGPRTTCSPTGSALASTGRY